MLSLLRRIYPATHGKRGLTLSGRAIFKVNLLPSKGSDPFCHGLLGALFLVVATCANADEGRRLEVWYPYLNSPKLITPQWVGEEAVECVVTLAIDDMREPAKYEAYLRPILQRLKQIDGRAPVSIMTCNVKPDDPQLQSWLQEGLSLECHTFDHPCPILAGGDIQKAKGTYDKCVDLLNSVPNNHPVAFRTPCCDSLNTVSPRLFSEIINQQTPGGNFLQLDSSVFTLFTAADPSLPQTSLIDPDGREKFRKYIPRKLARGNLVHDGFVNLIENYPYPYVIRGQCWEFPCVVPSDWSANHLQKPNNPDTVRDLKIALDLTVQKQGVFNLVFHPHGWIKSEQVIELIDHAVTTHGQKVKFLNFRECLQRLNQHLLDNKPLRNRAGDDVQTDVIDVNTDGYVDVVSRHKNDVQVRIWDHGSRQWKAGDATQIKLAAGLPGTATDVHSGPKRPSSIESVMPGQKDALRYVDVNEDGHSDLVFSNGSMFGVWLQDPAKQTYVELIRGGRGQKDLAVELPPILNDDGSDNGFFVRDRQLCWINEGTDGLTDFVMRIAFDTLLKDQIPTSKTPAAARQSMRVAAGYRVDLVAHEPLTMDPVALDWGPDGRMWVAEMADYPRGIDDKGQPGGRIRQLEDTDGDGIYDKSTLFLDAVPFPNGVLSWKRGVLVSAAPDVFYAEDTDGDGKADLKKVLFTGFSEGNQQHRANGFARGLDNWLYLANGDSGGAIRVVGTLSGVVPEGKIVDIRSRDVRIRPDTGDIEAVAGQSQFGRNRDNWGNWFGNNNSRPMWHYLLDDHYLRRNSFLIVPNLQKDISVTPGAAPVFPASRTLTRFNDFHTANRFTSACSSMVYRDELIRTMAGESQVFISEPVHNLVHREVMRPDGLTFISQRAASEEQSEFLASTDNWFRPTQLKTGPDGALYVADMYRLVIEHPQWIPIEWQRRLDLRAGQEMGRIWRVAPANVTLRPVPRLNSMTTAELVAALSHPNGWQRDLAQQLLLDRADPTAIPLLLAQATARPAETDEQSTSLALGRLHSLCTLDGLAAKETLLQALPVALKDPHPGVRRHAVRLCDGFPQPTEPLWQGLVALVDDPDPQVRLQLAYTLGQLQHPQAGSVLGRLAAANSSLAPQFTTAVISSLNAANLELVLAEVMKQGPSQTELLQQLLAQATAFNHEGALVSLLNRATEPSRNQEFERWQFQAVEQFLISLERRFTSLDKWLGELSPPAKPVANRLQGLFDAARTITADETKSPDDRIAALRILGRSTNSTQDVPLLVTLITPQQAPELQSAALATLARSRSPEVAKPLLASFRSLAPSLRTQLSDILLSRDAWRDELLGALESKLISPADLDAATRQRLLDHKTKSVADRAARVLSVNLNSNRAKLVADYLPIVREGGDAQLGRQLFQKMCSQCHKLGEVGHAVGPDLASLTDKSPDAMLTAVLDPNRAVETKYLTFTAITKAGVTHTGLMAAETAGSLTLRAAEGKEITLLRSEIDELQSNSKSLMPEGLERDLKPADAAALVAYIRRNVPLPAMKSFAGNEPKVVVADASGKFVLTPFTGEIYGPTIVIEDAHQNLGWWSSAEDVVVWTINVPQPGKYSVNWHYACDPSAAGSRLIVDAAGKSLSHRVEKTTSWDDYRTQTLGELELPAGQVRVTLKPASPPLPALADVKSVTLSPKH
ncbi:MAG: HEAT repeat domain-containing protein [Planctomycetes bacterium]|nr:HEAT repeat domain-containing protein [Planctomycetota bacterium]